MENTPCRCSWVKLSNPIYIKYHDEEWGIPLHDDRALYELFILETFQAGLSWETILNKRENFRRAYEGFIPVHVAAFDAKKIDVLMQDAGIVRNRRKIEASIINSRIFLNIAAEYGSFDCYIWGFTDGKSIRESCELRTTSPLSDKIAKDLKQRGMKFVGSTCIYSTLQSIGILSAHTDDCDWGKS
jgi:DNA-3-methyladenine glycosylase I